MPVSPSASAPQSDRCFGCNWSNIYNPGSPKGEWIELHPTAEGEAPHSGHERCTQAYIENLSGFTDISSGSEKYTWPICLDRSCLKPIDNPRAFPWKSKVKVITNTYLSSACSIFFYGFFLGAFGSKIGTGMLATGMMLRLIGNNPNKEISRRVLDRVRTNPTKIEQIIPFLGVADWMGAALGVSITTLVGSAKLGFASGLAYMTERALCSSKNISYQEKGLKKAVAAVAGIGMTIPSFYFLYNEERSSSISHIFSSLILYAGLTGGTFLAKKVLQQTPSPYTAIEDPLRLIEQFAINLIPLLPLATQTVEMPSSLFDIPKAAMDFAWGTFTNLPDRLGKMPLDFGEAAKVTATTMLATAAALGVLRLSVKVPKITAAVGLGALTAYAVSSYSA